MARTYRYCVLRAIPDKRRGECVNIGIAVITEAEIDVRILSSLGKVTALNGSVDVGQLHELPTTIGTYLKQFPTVDARHAALQRMGIVTASDLGWFETGPSVDYETSVTRLMRTLVLPVTRRTTTRLHQRLKTSLRDRFRKQGILGVDLDAIDKHLVVANYPIDPNE